MDFTRSVVREYDAPDRAVLHLEARSGTVTVEAHGQSKILIEAIVHVWSDHAAEADEAIALVDRGMTQDEQQRVIVRAPSLPQSEGWSFWGKRGARVDYNVLVPVRTAVRVLSRSGRVGIARTTGRLHVESGSGRINVEEVTGDVALVSRSGSISVSRITGGVSVEVRSGKVDVRDINGKLVVQTRSGSTDVRGITGDAEVRGHTGSVSLEDMRGGVYARAHSGSIRFRGRVSGDLSLSAHTGSITLAVDPAQGFFLDAESETGSVKSELPPKRGASAPSEGPAYKVRLRAHTGSIRITRM